MTISDRSASGGNEIALIGVGGTGPGPGKAAPPDEDPAVIIRAISGRVVAGSPFTITADLDEKRAGATAS